MTDPRPAPTRRKFGYETEREKGAIRAALIEERHDPNDIGFQFKVIKRYEEAHANDEPFSVRSKRWREEQLAQSAPPDPTLEPDEIEYLLFRLSGVNDPMGQKPVSKLLQHKGNA